MLLAGLCMALTAFAVYAMTSPRSAQPSAEPAPEPPARPTSKPVTTASATRPPRPAPSAPSATPSIQEWADASRVSVASLPERSCTAKMVREWLRVACDGTNATGGAPREARVLAAKEMDRRVGAAGVVHVAWQIGPDNMYTAAGTSILSLVCPFVEGIDFEARFDWSDSTARLHIKWATGLAEPSVKGTFTPGKR